MHYIGARAYLILCQSACQKTLLEIPQTKDVYTLAHNTAYVNTHARQTKRKDHVYVVFGFFLPLSSSVEIE